jgi:hypothetical protein
LLKVPDRSPEDGVIEYPGFVRDSASNESLGWLAGTDVEGDDITACAKVEELGVEDVDSDGFGADDS